MNDLQTVLSSIALDHAKPILTELEQRGYSRTRLFAEAGMSLKQADTGASGVLLPTSDFSRLYGHACRQLEAMTSGRWDDSRITKDAQDMMCYCIITCRTLGEAIERARVYCRVASPLGQVLHLQQTGRSAELALELRRQRCDNASRLVCLSTINMLHHLFSWLVGSALRLQSVLLNYPRPLAQDVPGALAGQPLRWEAGRDAMIFPADYLALPVVRSAAELEQVIDYFIYDIQLYTGRLQTLSGQLRALLLRALQKDLAPIHSNTAAQLLHLSGATMRRNLRREGTSFAAILSECLYVHASHLLQCTDMTIAEIAARIGYGDDRAFRRAFRGWTGLSPTAYRREAEAAIAPAA